jgi:hypothetical protein
MALLGKAAIAIWIEISPEFRVEHDRWHSVEHFPERLAIPGFLRGRRCASLSEVADCRFVLYELEHVGVTTSAAYLERLNNPTPWSQQVFPQVKLTRALCRIAASHGEGLGGTVMTIRFAPMAERQSALESWLDDLLPRLPGQHGIVAAHLLRRDTSIVRPVTAEQQLRKGGTDASADWVLMLEGHDPDAIGAAVSLRVLADHGADAAMLAATYGLAHAVSSLK